MTDNTAVAPRRADTTPRTWVSLAAAVALVLLWAAHPGQARGQEPGHGTGHAEALPGEVPDTAGANGKEHGAHGAHGGHTTHLDNWFSFSFGPGTEHVNGPLGIAILNFALLLFLLFKFARKPLVSFLETRHETIKKNLQEAAQLRERAREKLQEIDTKLARIDEEIARIKADVAKDAELERERIIQIAEAESERIVKMADKALEQELRRARRLLEVEAVDLALKAAESLIRKSINDADQRRINDDYVSEIASQGDVH